MKKTVTNTLLEKKVVKRTLWHCFATHLLECETDIRDMLQLLGHSIIKTTMIYTQITPRAAKNIVSSLDLLLRTPGLKA